MVRRVAEIRVPALRIPQHPRIPLFLFAVSAGDLGSIAGVSRISRNETGRVQGFQRAEVRRHIQDIVHYLDKGPTLFPHSLVLAFSGPMRFERAPGERTSSSCPVTGTLVIRPRGDGQPPGLIVDGQQRSVALARSTNRALLVPVAAFVTSELEVQRDQFIRINNTRPLPRGLVAELLPEMDGPVPRRLAAYKGPALLLEKLMQEHTSPFFGLVRVASHRLPGIRVRVAGSALLAMLRDSMERPGGCLFGTRLDDPKDLDRAYDLLEAFWSAVRDAFPNAWGRPPSESRLMHAIGLRAMGRLMDKVMRAGRPLDPADRCALRDELGALVDVCRWTDGRWDDAVFGLEWNQLQMVSSHLKALSGFLVDRYRERAVTP